MHIVGKLLEEDEVRMIRYLLANSSLETRENGVKQNHLAVTKVHLMGMDREEDYLISTLIMLSKTRGKF